MVSVDAVVFARVEGRLWILLVRRGNDPFAGCWALPGGFLEMNEDLDTGAYRELAEETGLTDVKLEQLYTFGRCDRDPRGRTITVAYLALIFAEKLPKIKAGDDASAVRWFAIDELPPLAFDHHEIITLAQERLKQTPDPS